MWLSNSEYKPNIELHLILSIAIACYNPVEQYSIHVCVYNYM